MSTITTDLQLVSTNAAGDATTGWTRINGPTTSNPAVDPDVKVQGTNCIKNANTNTSVFPTECGEALNAFTAINCTNKLIFSWRNQSFPSNLPAKGTFGGCAIYVSGGATATTSPYKVWDLDGSDTDLVGGWKVYAVDPSRTSGKTAGSLNVASITSIGFTRMFLTSVAVAMDYIDVVRYGTGLKLKNNSGITGSEGSFLELYSTDSLNANAYGVVTNTAGIYYLQGKIFIGGDDAAYPTSADNQTALTFFWDTNQTLVWLPRPVAADVYEIRCAANATQHTVVQLGNYDAAALLSSGGVTIKGAVDTGALASAQQTPGTLTAITVGDTTNNRRGVGMSFICNEIGSTLKSVWFWAAKVGTPTGTLYARLYEHSGTYGTSSVAATTTAGSFVVGAKYQIVTVGTTSWTSIGAASNTQGLIFTATGVGSGTGVAARILATSDPIDPTTLSTTAGWVVFTFSGAERITLNDGATYVIAYENDGYTGTSSNTTQVYSNGSSAFPGNYCTKGSAYTWTATASTDIAFRLYTTNRSATWKLTASNTNNNNILKIYGSSLFNIISSSLNGNARSINVTNCTTTSGSRVLTTTNNWTTSFIVPGMSVTGTGIPSSTFVASIESNTSLTLTKAATSSATNTLTFGDKTEIIDTSFSQIGPMTPNGATIRNCIFSNVVTSAPVSATNALIINSTTDLNNKITACTFINCNRAIRITSPGTYTFDGLMFSGNVYDVENTSNGLVTINPTNGSNVSTFINTGGGTTVISLTPRTITLTAINEQGLAVSGAQVLVKARSGTGSFPVDATVTITNSGTTATVTHTAHGLASGDKVLIKGASLYHNNGAFTITVTDANTYTYTMISAPGSNPTGTIKSTFVFLYGATDVNGQISMSRTIPADQTYDGWVRKTSASPYYKTSQLSGTISSSSDTQMSSLLISDE